MAEKEPEDKMAVVDVPVAIAVVTDSSEGLARMYKDLEPLAARLRSAAFGLLLFSILFMGSLEGMFGLVAACGVLCCAAPGSLGVAYAARCTRIAAIMCASIALMHTLCLTTFATVVLPEMPAAISKACEESKMSEGAAIRADGAAPASGQLAQLISAGFASLDGPAREPLPTTEAPVEVSGTATMIASVATTASRRLQEYVQPDSAASCARTQRLFHSAVPTFVLGAAIGEFGLFLTAISTAKAASRILIAARKFGANAI